MQTTYESIKDFQHNQNTGAPIHLMVTIKSFDVEAIRARYLQSKKRNKVGSVERRKAGTGGIAYLIIENGEIVHQEILARMKEPRGIASNGKYLAIAPENIVYIFNNSNIQTISNPWFSYIHTVSFNPETLENLLICSSGFEAIFEYNLNDLSQQYEWFAWDHGFNKSYDADIGGNRILTRDPEEAEKLKQKGIPVLLISNPEEQTLATAKRAAFINGAYYYYHKPDKLLVTLFHEGAVYAIDRKDHSMEQIFSGLTSCHGGMSYGNNYMVTNTGKGEVVLRKDQTNQVCSFRELPGKPDYLKSIEWVQNSHKINEEIISIDANRNAFVLFNPIKKHYSIIPFDKNWAIQDIALASPTLEQKELIGSLSVRDK